MKTVKQKKLGGGRRVSCIKEKLMKKKESRLDLSRRTFPV